MGKILLPYHDHVGITATPHLHRILNVLEEIDRLGEDGLSAINIVMWKGISKYRSVTWGVIGSKNFVIQKNVKILLQISLS